MNPFPGATCYREGQPLLGRDADAAAVRDAVLAHRFVTLYGPSGAGKSSLLRAGLVPRLEAHRAVVLDVWPEDTPPLSTFVRSLYQHLLGVSEAPSGMDQTPLDVLELAAGLDPRPIVLVLDQMEQVLMSPDAQGAAAFLRALAEVEAQASAGLHVVLAIREDYYGLFCDAARDHARLLAHALRLGRLTVGSMLEVVVRTASAAGRAPTPWTADELRPVVAAMALPGRRAEDEREVEAALVQVACAELWRREQATGKPLRGTAALKVLSREGLDLELGPLASLFRSFVGGHVEAMLGRLQKTPEAERQRALAHHLLAVHFRLTLAALPGGARGEVRKLLTGALVGAGGLRRLVTEAEALRTFRDPEVGRAALAALERARVLLAEQHPDGSRMFQLGHDWLARMVDRGRAMERSYTAGAVLYGLFVVGAIGLLLWRWHDDASLQTRRDELAAGLHAAAVQRVAASDPTLAAALLRDLPPELRPLSPFYEADALGVELSNVARHLLPGHDGGLAAAAFFPDGERVATLDQAGTLRYWDLENGGLLGEAASGGPRGADLLIEDDGRAVWVAYQGGRLSRFPTEGTFAPLRTVTTTLADPRLAVGATADSVLAADTGGVVRIEAGKEAPVEVLVGPLGPRWGGRLSRLALPSMGPSRGYTVSRGGVVARTGDDLWLIRRGESVALALPDTLKPLREAALSPDARILAVMTDDGFQSFALSGGETEPRHELPGRGLILAVADDGRVVLATDGTIRVLQDGRTWSPIRHRVPGDGPIATSVGFTADGRYLLVGGTDGLIRAFDDRDQSLGTLLGHRGGQPIRHISALSPTWLLTAGGDEAPRLWRTRHGLPYTEQTPGLSGRLVGVDTPTGREVVFEGEPGDIVRMGAGGARRVVEAPKGCRPHGVFSSNGGVVAWGCVGLQGIGLMRGPGAPEVVELDFTATEVEICPGGRDLLAKGPLGGIHLRLPSSGPPERLPWPLPARAEGVRCGTSAGAVAYAHQGRLRVQARFDAPAVELPDGERDLLGPSQRLGGWLFSAPSGMEIFPLEAAGPTVEASATYAFGAPVIGFAEVPAEEAATYPVLLALGTGEYRFLSLDPQILDSGFTDSTARSRIGSERMCVDAPCPPSWRPDAWAAAVSLGAGRWVTATEEHVLLWDISPQALETNLRKITSLCVPAATRRLFLRESEDQAREAYLACEAAQRP